MTRDPWSRLHHQLPRSPAVVGHLLKVVPMPGGHRALGAEEKLHRRVRRNHPVAQEGRASP